MRYLILFCLFTLGVGFAESAFRSVDQETLALEDLLAVSHTSLSPYGLQTQQSLNLDVSGGLGFHCGKFDPAVSVSNTMNQVKDRVKHFSDKILESVTAAVISLPMYKVAQANPKLYNLLNHQLISAEEQFGIAMKTCNQMEQEALAGKNPYQEWIQVSREKTMAQLQKNGTGEKDIHHAFQQLEEVDGKAGVPWIGKERGQRGVAAGGSGQSPIWVIQDIARAGFYELYPAHDKDEKMMWSSAEDAATWITQVVGDQLVSTCSGSGCRKGSKTPRGLYPDIEANKQTIKILLLERVEHSHAGGFQAHVEQEDDWGITPRLVERLRHFDVHNQHRMIDVLSENIATTQSIKKALLSKRILKAGSALPEAIVIGEVQKQIASAIAFLNQEVSDILSTFEIKNTLFKSDLQQFFQLDQTLMQGAVFPETPTYPQAFNKAPSASSQRGGA